MQRDTRFILIQAICALRQSERVILYSLHRSACSRGLQAGQESGLVPGLCVERRGLLEMLISRSEERVYYRVLLVAYACVYLSNVSMNVCVRSSGVSPSPRNGPGHPLL